MLEVAYISTTDLIPYANNPRTHSDQQVAQVAASIQEFGFNNPILIDEHNSIIAGHGRLAAAQKLGMGLVPTITLEGLTEAQRKAYVIADNKLTENGGWDYDTLAIEVDRLKELDADIGLLGFELSDLEFTEPESVALGLTPEQKLDNFLNGDTKILRLAYDEDEMESLVAMLDKGLSATGLDDYSSLVYSIVREASTRW
jgi:ParB-like chromosome segregation protein Spo0J